MSSPQSAPGTWIFFLLGLITNLVFQPLELPQSDSTTSSMKMFTQGKLKAGKSSTAASRQIGFLKKEWRQVVNLLVDAIKVLINEHDQFGEELCAINSEAIATATNGKLLAMADDGTHKDQQRCYDRKQANAKDAISETPNKPNLEKNACTSPQYNSTHQPRSVRCFERLSKITQKNSSEDSFNDEQSLRISNLRSPTGDKMHLANRHKALSLTESNSRKSHGSDDSLQGTEHQHANSLRSTSACRILTDAEYSRISARRWNNSFKSVREQPTGDEVVPCKYEENGCTKSGLVEVITQHELNCLHQPMQCPNAQHGCTALVTRYNFNNHLDNYCKMKACAYCNRLYHNSRISEHEERCKVDTRHLGRHGHFQYDGGNDSPFQPYFAKFV